MYFFYSSILLLHPLVSRLKQRLFAKTFCHNGLVTLPRSLAFSSYAPNFCRKFACMSLGVLLSMLSMSTVSGRRKIAATFAIIENQRLQRSPSIFACFGLSHHKAPLAVRESFALKNGDLPKASRNLQSINGLLESMVLSTCNRLGLRFRQRQNSMTRVGRHFCEANHFDPVLFRSTPYSHNLSTWHLLALRRSGFQMVEDLIFLISQKCYDVARLLGRLVRCSIDYLNEVFMRRAHLLASLKQCKCW